jgi:hypothetical protein
MSIDEHNKHFEMRQKLFRYWEEAVPAENRRMLCVYGLVKYECVVEIDKEGDIYNQMPHVFVEFHDGGPIDYNIGRMSNGGYVLDNDDIEVNLNNKIEFFPAPEEINKRLKSIGEVIKKEEEEKVAKIKKEKEERIAKLKNDEPS